MDDGPSMQKVATNYMGCTKCSNSFQNMFYWHTSIQENAFAFT